MTELLTRERFVASALATVVGLAHPAATKKPAAQTRPAKKKPAGKTATKKPAAKATTAKRHGRGAVLRASDFSNGPQLTDPATLAGTPFVNRTGPPPKSYQLSAPPPVVDQGTLDSCCAHAFGYGLGGYTAAKAHGATPAPSHLPSRAWLFANEMLADDRGKSCALGTYPLGYLEQLISAGAPSETQVPYKEDCSYIMSVESKLQNYTPQSALRIGSYRTILLSLSQMAQQLPLLQAHMANGQIIAFAGRFGNDYDDPALRGGVYYADKGFSTAEHAQLLIGYDDSKGTQGAFLVQNSYGTAWPTAKPGGRVWWDYHTFFRSQSCAAVALPALTGPPQGKPLHASLASAPAARVSSVHRAAYAKGSYDLVLVHDFERPVTLQRVTVTPPKGAAHSATTTMKLTNGYSLIPSTTPWQAKVAYALRIQATAAGQAVTYTGTISV